MHNRGSSNREMASGEALPEPSHDSARSLEVKQDTITSTNQACTSNFLTNTTSILREEVDTGINKLLNLLGDSSSDLESQEIQVVWSHMDSILTLLEAPEALILDDRNTGQLATMTILSMLESDDAHRKEPESFDLRVRCMTLIMELTCAPEDKQGLILALDGATLSHLDQLHYASSESAYHLDIALEYHARMKSLDYYGDSVDISQMLSEIGSLQYRNFTGSELTAMGKINDFVMHHRLARQQPKATTGLDIALECMTTSVMLTPNYHSSLPSRLQTLALMHLMKYLMFYADSRLSDHMVDINAGIEYQSRAASLTPRDHPDYHQRMAYLAFAYTTRSNAGTGKKSMEDVNKAHALYPPALSRHADTTLSFHLAHAKALEHRFESGEGLDNIREAIEALSNATQLETNIRDFQPIRTSIISHLGALHRKMFRSLGRLIDIDNAIDFYTKALLLTSNEHDHNVQGKILLGLIQSLQARYNRLHDPNDNDRAMKYLAELYSRQEKMGLSLVEMIELHSTLVQAQSGIIPLRYQGADNLDYSYIAALDGAMKRAHQWLSAFPEGHDYHSACLSFLSRLYLDRFNHKKDSVDLDESIKYMTKATSTEHMSNIEQTRWLLELAKIHDLRLVHTKKPEDYDQAIEYATRALSLLPEDHIDRADYLTMIAFIHSHRYTISSNPQSSEWARATLNCFREAALSVGGYPTSKLKAAQVWAMSSTGIGWHDRALEGFEVAMSIVPEVVWLGATISRRFNEIETIRNLALHAAALGISSRKYLKALEWLEQGRFIVWNQTLQLRTPLEDLHLADSVLAQRLQEVSGELHYASTQSSPLPIGTMNYLESDSMEQRRRRLAEEYQQLIEKAREIPAFKDFLRTKPASDLLNVARSGPVVVVNISAHNCDALILTPGCSEVTHVPLPEVSIEKVQDACNQLDNSLRRHYVRERGFHRVDANPKNPPADTFEDVLIFLWSAIAKPVLDVLGYIENPPIGELPRLTWCTTGRLAMLPLHAAGYYNRPRCKLSDFVVSSYTPTLSALISASSTPSIRHSDVLAISQEKTPGQSHLPGTKQELDFINKHASEPVVFSQINNADATCELVLQAMENSDWVHLACHAHQNVTDPTESGFFLQDGTLSLKKIIQKSFKDKGLAFLSACQTAKGDERLADEAVHLASGMLLAGYRSVIATMWSVVDADAPVIADQVYGQLLKCRRMDYRDSARALHAAVNVLREKVGDKEFTRWVPYIHIGA
ncbi:unnamed protein product [Rhizoctonia solani]|uniref:CHAT domain-containing protein n=1 Tax=Rhizoctonia solani TaxID=456999 RepID=A0A8H2XL51_9AGAM|nr:unnamed protein product [Rhizoctonia solani]